MSRCAEGTEPAKNTWLVGGESLSYDRDWDENMAEPAAVLSSVWDSSSDGWEEEDGSMTSILGSDTGSESDHPPDSVEDPRWYSWMMAQAERSGSECTDVRSQAPLDSSSEFEFSELADETNGELSYSADMFSLPKAADEPPTVTARPLPE